MADSGTDRPRRLRYSVAMSLDGFIAGPEGEYDWIPEETTIDFRAFVASIDTLVMGRKTYVTTAEAGTPGGGFQGMTIYVFSGTLDPAEHPAVTVISEGPVTFVRRLKGEPGMDIWLFGGGMLFRTLLEARLVDRVEVGIVPALLGQGIPLLPGLEGRARMTLHSTETFPSGIVLAKYDVVNEG